MPTKAVLFDMFDTLMLIEKDHEFYAPSMRRMYNYLCSVGVDVPFERFEDIYIHERDKLFAQADLKFEEPHFNVRVAATLSALGYSYDIKSPVVAEATGEFCEEFMKYVKIDPDAEATLKALQKKIPTGHDLKFRNPRVRAKTAQSRRY